MKALSAAVLALLSVSLVAFAARLDDEASREAFIAKFRQANEISDVSEMARLIQKNQFFAVDSVVYTAEAISNGPTEQLEKDMSGLRKGWKQAYRTSFVDDMYEYFSLLKPNVKRERAVLRVRYDKAAAKYNEAEAAKDKNAFPGVAADMEAVGGAFAQLGDRYYESQSFLFAALCVDERLRGDDADLQRAFQFYKRCYDAREAVGLLDQNYIEVKQRLDTLEHAGWGVTEEGGEGGAAGREPGKPVEGAVTTAAMAFALLPDVTSIGRPSYVCDDVYPAWSGVYLASPGSSSKFQAFEKRVPLVMRESSSRVVIDQDGDGIADVEVPLKGKVLPVEVEIGEGAAQRKWAFFVMTGGSQDTYQGIQISLAETEEHMTLYVNAAGSMVGTVGETEIRVIDDNMDGVYGSPPKTWGNMGTTKDVYQVEVDSIVVGGEKRARPWSEYQAIGDKWYRLEALDGGNRVQATEVELPTGTLKLKMKGPKPTYVVLQGTGELLKNSCFDLLQNGNKGVEVPAGKYQLAVGLIQNGKRMDIRKALMLKGANTRTWTVKGGETTTVELGQPFGFDFDVVVGDSTVQVVGQSVAVTGVANERYERIWNCVPKPEVSVREVGAKRGSKPEDMHLVGSQDEITTRGWVATWHPLDIELEKPKNAESVEVQLVEKKNKLFGSIESDWKR